MSNTRYLDCGCAITPFGVLQKVTCPKNHDEDIEDEFYEYGEEWYG